jgi:pimeloyl-ACP methyl ester carboxylesterase
VKELVGENLVQYGLLERGGHFLAWEEPELLANSVIEFFESEKVQKKY